MKPNGDNLLRIEKTSDDVQKGIGAVSRYGIIGKQTDANIKTVNTK